MWDPKMWVGSPSAEASNWLSAVVIEHDKSRAPLITADRAGAEKRIRHLPNYSIKSIRYNCRKQWIVDAVRLR